MALLVKNFIDIKNILKQVRENKHGEFVSYKLAEQSEIPWRYNYYFLPHNQIYLIRSTKLITVLMQANGNPEQR